MFIFGFAEQGAYRVLLLAGPPFQTPFSNPFREPALRLAAHRCPILGPFSGIV